MVLYVPERRRVPRARAWWDVARRPEAKDGRATRDFSSASKCLRPLLEEAVRAQLIADVPVGLFLSSGLDSSVIAALAAREQAGICSFTLSFPGTTYDEAPLARSVARHCGTQHREIPLKGDAIVSRLDEALAALDQPSMDGINTYFVSWAARQAGLKVALSGLERAADEARKLEAMGGISWLEMRCYMASTLLRDTDSVSMARSLEVRVPLLDTPLVEFVNALPDAVRRRDGSPKALLKEAIGDLLPQEILTQKKRTFTLPWEEWLRGPLRKRIEASFAEPAAELAPYLRSDGVRQVWSAFLAGKTSWSRPWSIYVLNEWCRKHL